MQSSDDLERKYFEFALDAEAWRATARQLKAAADLIEPKLEIFWTQIRSGPVPSSSWRPWDDEWQAIHFMLSAFALENAIKARIVEIRGAELAAEMAKSKRLPAVLASHDLVQLCMAAGKAPLAREHESLLRRLERAAVWYGRYPIPTRPWGLNQWREGQGELPAISLTMYATGEQNEIAQLLEKFGVRNSE